jgi:hypothetical protein
MTHVRTHSRTHTHTQFRRAHTHTQHACSHVYSSGSSAAQSTGPPLSFSGKKSLKSSFQNSCACFSENHYERLLSLSLSRSRILSQSLRTGIIFLQKNALNSRILILCQHAATQELCAWFLLLPPSLHSSLV